MRTPTRFFKYLLMLCALVILAGGAGLVYLTYTAYRPAEQERVDTVEGTVHPLLPGDTLKILTLDTGFAGLDGERDSYLYGGTHVRALSEDRVQENLEGIGELLQENPGDVVLLQSVDEDATRSYGVDQFAYYTHLLGYSHAQVYDRVCTYVPYPFPPLGRIRSGLLTLSNREMQSAQRVALPEVDTWPRTIGGNRNAVLVTRLPIVGTEQALVICNVRLEELGDSMALAAQREWLLRYVATLYRAGDYVILGGNLGNGEDGSADPTGVLQGWHFAQDTTVPTARSLATPYDAESSQTHVAHGFWLSPNLICQDVHTVDGGFRFSAYNPVLLTVTLEADRNA